MRGGGRSSHPMHCSPPSIIIIFPSFAGSSVEQAPLLPSLLCLSSNCRHFLIDRVAPLPRRDIPIPGRLLFFQLHHNFDERHGILQRRNRRPSRTLCEPGPVLIDWSPTRNHTGEDSVWSAAETRQIPAEQPESTRQSILDDKLTFDHRFICRNRATGVQLRKILHRPHKMLPRRTLS